MVVHCFFEQSGTFKNEFKSFGIQAYDYDVLNDFNETDYIIDLFQEIDFAYSNKSSIFDNISTNDLIMAFFPCTRFSNQAYMMFQCTQKQLKDLSDLHKVSKVLQFHGELSYLYTKLCQLCIICMRKNLKLILENPYSQEHYLTRYFPLKPSLIDLDRRLRGDKFKKPTQYWFINCKPTFNIMFESCVYFSNETISNIHNNVERSMITSEYANRFIKEFIL